MSTPEGGIGTGGGTATQPGITRADIEATLRAVLGSNGGASKTDPEVLRIISDNFEYRETQRQLKAEVKRLTEQLPAEGSLVLTPDQKKEWEAFTAIGKPAAEVVKSLEAGEKAIGENAKLSTQVLLAKVAKSEGYTAEDAATVLQTILGDAKIESEVVLEPDPEDDKKKVGVERFFIIGQDAQGVKTKERVSTVIEAKHKAFLPALTAEPGESGGEGSEEGGRSDAGRGSANSGTPFPRQERGSRADANTKNLAKSVVGALYTTPKQPTT